MPIRASITKVIEKKLLAETGKSLRVYNLGTPGMQAPFYYFTLKKYLETHAAPKFVVFNISYYLLGGMQWFEDIYLAYYRPTLSEVFLTVRTGVISPTTALVWYFRGIFPSLRAASSRFLSNVNLLWDKARAAEIEGKVREVRDVSLDESFGGYLPRHENLPPIPQFTITTRTDLHDPVLEEYFVRFSELARHHGIQIVVFQFLWPLWDRDQEPFKKAYGFYQNHITEFFTGFANVSMIENEHFYENQYFSDPLHLNHRGAIRLSDDLGNVLAKRPEFKSTN